MQALVTNGKLQRGNFSTISNTLRIIPVPRCSWVCEHKLNWTWKNMVYGSPYWDIWQGSERCKRQKCIKKELVTFNSSKTVIVYLVRIRNSINEVSTVAEYILLSNKLTEPVNMQYTHITMDAGTATKFCQIFRNNKNKYKKVLFLSGAEHDRVQIQAV